MAILIAFLLIGLVPAFIAKNKGRSFMGWYVISILLSPLIGLIAILCLGESDEMRKQRIIEEEKIRSSELV